MNLNTHSAIQHLRIFRFFNSHIYIAEIYQKRAHTYCWVEGVKLLPYRILLGQTSDINSKLCPFQIISDKVLGEVL